MQFSLVVYDRLHSILINSNQADALRPDGALIIQINGDLTGGTVTITAPDADMREIDAALADGFPIPLAAGVNTADPIFYNFMTGHFHLVGENGEYRYVITLGKDLP